MGCGSSNSDSTASKNGFNPENVLDVEEGYPPPSPPASKKWQVFRPEEFQDIDQRSKKVPRDKCSTYKGLIGYLTKGLTSDLQKVRAIFIWLGSQRIYDEDYGNVSKTNTPCGYMKLIKDKKGHYATFFALLCRAAGIPCVIIRGLGKSAHYEAGDRDLTACQSSWNAVHVQGTWRLVHPLWAFTAVTGSDGSTREVTENHECTQNGVRSSHQGSTGTSSPSRKTPISDRNSLGPRDSRGSPDNSRGKPSVHKGAKDIDRNGRNFSQRLKRANGWVSPGRKSTKKTASNAVAPVTFTPYHQTSIDEDYFLTDPEHFVYVCRPLREEWQLLPEPWTMNQFLSVPYFQLAYFSSGLELVSSHHCRLSSEGGICKVSFRIPPDSDVLLRGSLLFNQAESSTRLPDDVHLSDHVIMSAENDVTSVIARLPSRGVYKLSVFGGAEGKDHLCDFRLQCVESIHRGKPFPFQPEVGIGYGEAAKAAGLILPSATDGVLKLRPRESAEVTFKSRDPVEIRTRMVHSSIASHRLSDYVSAIRVGKEIRVRVVMPDPGDLATDFAEFGVEVEVRGEGQEGAFRNVLNFLVTVDGIQAKRRSRKTVDSHPARMDLIEATEGEDIKALEAAIRRFQREMLPDAEDMQEAKEKLIYLHRIALTDAIEGRNLEELEDVIHRTESSAVFGHLRQCWELPEAEMTRDQLRRLKYFLHKILELNQQTISEVHRYHTSLPAVHDVMQATYLLLGEREENLVKWSYVQKLMRRTGRRSLIRRVQNFDVVRVNLSDAIRASRLLDGYDQFSVHQTSAGAGAFFVWCCSIIDEIQQQEAEALQSMQESCDQRGTESGMEGRPLTALTEEEEAEEEVNSDLSPLSPRSQRREAATPTQSGTSPSHSTEQQTRSKGGNSSHQKESDEFVFGNFDSSTRQGGKVEGPKRSPREEHYYAG